MWAAARSYTPRTSTTHSDELCTGRLEQLGDAHGLGTGAGRTADPDQPERLQLSAGTAALSVVGLRHRVPAGRDVAERALTGSAGSTPIASRHPLPVEGVGGVEIGSNREDIQGGPFHAAVPDRERLELAADEEHATGRTRREEVLAQLEHERRAWRRAVRPGHGPRLGPADVLDRDQRAAPASAMPRKTSAGVHRQPDRLLERGGREIQIEKAIGIAPVAVERASHAHREIEAAELEPGPAVVRRSGEVAAEEADRHVALALALQGGRARGDVGIDGAPGPRPQAEAGHSTGEPPRRRGAAQASLPER